MDFDRITMEDDSMVEAIRYFTADYRDGRVYLGGKGKDAGYYGWIMQGDFTKNTKDCFTRIRMRLKK